MRHLTSRFTIGLLVFGLLVLGVGSAVHAQEALRGESVFTDATPTDLGSGAIPAFPATPANLGLQRVHIAPGGHIDTPADDPRVVLLTVEQGTLTVQNTVPVTVTRQTQAQESVPAGTTYTMTVGETSLSPAGSGGFLRNDGTDEVILLAAIIWPAAGATPTP